MVSRAGVLLQGSGVQQSGAVVLGKQPEILLLPLSKNWASHTAPKACAKEAKEVYNAKGLKYTTPTAFQTKKRKNKTKPNPSGVCATTPNLLFALLGPPRHF